MRSFTFWTYFLLVTDQISLDFWLKLGAVIVAFWYASVAFQACLVSLLVFQLVSVKAYQYKNYNYHSIHFLSFSLAQSHHVTFNELPEMVCSKCIPSNNCLTKILLKIMFCLCAFHVSTSRFHKKMAARFPELWKSGSFCLQEPKNQRKYKESNENCH